MTAIERERGHDEEVDVVVVGMGASGSVAAIQAAEGGATVLTLDRWGRGGASARSGGIVYAGGGTRQQLAAGFKDDPDAMERYLSLEEGVPVDDARLDRFCDRSLEDIGWLESHGVEFPMGFDDTKSVVPVDDGTGLYFSGNEKHYASAAPAVPRGHRVAGSGMSGHDLVEALHRAAARAGVDVRPRARLVGLIEDASGRVVGVDALVLPDDLRTRFVYGLYYRLLDVAGAGLRRIPRRLAAAVDRLEADRGHLIRIRARKGVVLATGGFSYNHELMAARAPAFASAMPLGTPGDDGSGVLMAEALGAATRMMDHCGASRFIAPPTAFCGGVLVDERGERICDESLYAATLSARIAEHGGRAWLVVDADERKRVREQIHDATRLRSRPLRELLSGRANHVVFPRLFGSINLFLNRRCAPDLERLAGKCGISPSGLRATVDAYNDDARHGRPDAMGKAEALVHTVEVPPFAAVPCHLDSLLFPAPCITLGGIDVDEGQRVRRVDGTTVPGLYAVGRCAAGVASRSYVSGLSLADCIYSGRTAGLSLTAATDAPTGGRADTRA